MMALGPAAFSPQPEAEEERAEKDIRRLRETSPGPGLIERHHGQSPQPARAMKESRLELGPEGRGGNDPGRLPQRFFLDLDAGGHRLQDPETNPDQRHREQEMPCR